MKIIATLSVNEDVLNQNQTGEENTIDKVISEFAWLHDSGITLNECYEIENVEPDNIDNEYQLLIWNKGKEEYSPVGQCQKTLEQCKQLSKIYLSLANPHVYDATKYKICRRKTYTVYEDRTE